MSKGLGAIRDLYANETSAEQEANKDVLDRKSPGVLRIEAMASSFNVASLSVLMFGVFLVSYAYGLDGSTRSSYQTEATNSFANHSLLSTLNVVKAVVAAASQPAFSKAADVFGRFELVSFSALFYVVGTIIEATSTNVQSYAGGQVIYQLGMTGFQLLFEVLIADLSSLRNRVLFSYLPAIPFLINAWVSGNVTSEVMANSTWEWGVAMWAIIIPVTCIPIYVGLFMANRRAKKAGKYDNIPSIYSGATLMENLSILFWQLDIIGVILLAAVLCLLLIPLTLAGGVSSSWHQPDIIAMLVIGFVCIPIFVFWELKFAKHPCIPFRLLKDRGVIACLVVALMLNTCWYLQGDFLYTMLQVAFDESIMSSTRITLLYSFSSVIVGIIGGFAVRYVRRIKWIAVFGTLIFTAALGMMIKYRSFDNGIAGLIGAQVLLGIGGGLFPYPVQALIQAATKHEHVAIITAVYLTTYQIGSAIGNSISGAIWTNTLPAKLEAALGPLNATLPTYAYSSPLYFIVDYPLGTPERTAMIGAYSQVQQLLTITGTALAVPLIIAALCLRNPVLGDTQALDNAEALSQASTEVEDEGFNQKTEKTEV
ncbi:ferrichrome-type siderophore transporter [Gongronella butleri]|nr:ferrichrome-type siderophore transporter [Gongronella butleri]